MWGGGCGDISAVFGLCVGDVEFVLRGLGLRDSGRFHPESGQT